MKLSVYTFVRNGIYFDFHTEAMLRHHLPLADEIIVNEGYSDDGTYEAISNIDPKINVFRSHWDRSDPLTWHIKFKNAARERCTGDWCILLDCDEFIPEWEFDRIRSTLASTDQDVLPLRFLHFYGNYKVKQQAHETGTPPLLKCCVHRNLPSINVWGDGANVRKGETGYCRPIVHDAFECHHFGEVRHPARLRQKWRTQARQHNTQNPRWDWLPGFVFNFFPHDWRDPLIIPQLDVYNGPYARAVIDDPDEFVRDGFQLYEYLLQRQSEDPSN